MFKIGEFAKLTKVSVRMLRYYDETGLLKPASIDKFTGYRLYSTNQIPTLQKILLLRDMEFSVSEIAVVLNQWNTETVIELLTAKKKEIAKTIELACQHIKKIDTAIQDFKRNQIEIHYNVTIKKIPSHQIVSLRKIVPDYFCEGSLWEELYAFVKTEHIELLPGTNNLTIFHNEGNLETGIDMETAVLVKKAGQNKELFSYRQTEAVKTMACIMVYGSYENIGPAYRSFAYWLEKHQQYEMNGPSRQICHIGAYNEKNAENFLTEIQTPVKLR